MQFRFRKISDHQYEVDVLAPGIPAKHVGRVKRDPVRPFDRPTWRSYEPAALHERPAQKAVSVSASREQAAISLAAVQRAKVSVVS